MDCPAACPKLYTLLVKECDARNDRDVVVAVVSRLLIVLVSILLFVICSIERETLAVLQE